MVVRKEEDSTASVSSRITADSTIGDFQAAAYTEDSAAFVFARIARYRAVGNDWAADKAGDPAAHPVR